MSKDSAHNCNWITSRLSIFLRKNGPHFVSWRVMEKRHAKPDAITRTDGNPVLVSLINNKWSSGSPIWYRLQYKAVLYSITTTGCASLLQFECISNFVSTTCMFTAWTIPMVLSMLWTPADCREKTGMRGYHSMVETNDHEDLHNLVMEYWYSIQYPREKCFKKAYHVDTDIFLDITCMPLGIHDKRCSNSENGMPLTPSYGPAP